MASWKLVTCAEMLPPVENCLVKRLNHSMINPKPVWLNSDTNTSQNSLVCLTWATLMTRSLFTHYVIMAFVRLTFFFQIQCFTICVAIWRNSFRAIDNTHYFARLKHILHSNQPNIIIFFVLKSIRLSLGENSCRWGGHVPCFWQCRRCRQLVSHGELWGGWRGRWNPGVSATLGCDGPISGSGGRVHTQYLHLSAQNLLMLHTLKADAYVARRRWRYVGR